jgi:hypothetical protein
MPQILRDIFAQEVVALGLEAIDTVDRNPRIGPCELELYSVIVANLPWHRKRDAVRGNRISPSCRSR